ncbi:uncharacterized protein LOC112340625 [Selaginella moellendorffii]|uniref:uncharacterized protein LOC112340625 n=1 Tax=Selaginella moellendorffii TaxID=88036 RepID=UPI000D1CD1A7|nr:uncharacterized protein LOC112340625 [Selaginella moellendorffii]|eukprot:XP_024515199.1 uncharacterized protein LOC112340625 [Selaginella moellendorffii]
MEAKGLGFRVRAAANRMETRVFPSRAYAWRLSFEGVMPQEWWDGFATKAEMYNSLGRHIKARQLRTKDVAPGIDKQVLVELGLLEEANADKLTKWGYRKLVREFNGDFKSAKALLIDFSMTTKELASLSALEMQEKLAQCLRSKGIEGDGFEKVLTVKSWVTYHNPAVGNLLPASRTCREEDVEGEVVNIVKIDKSIINKIDAASTKETANEEDKPPEENKSEENNSVEVPKKRKGEKKANRTRKKKKIEIHLKIYV